MQKKVLTEQALYFGDVSMPKGFEINKELLKSNILESILTNQSLKFSKTWDMLNTYVKDHIGLKHGIKLINKESWGNVYEQKEITPPLSHINQVNLQNSPDFILLYGVEVKNCKVVIMYDDNRRKGNTWEIPLKNNHFIMFPSTNLYYIVNENTYDFNCIQTITYEYV